MENWEYFILRDFSFFSNRFVHHIDMEFENMILYVQTYLFMVLNEMSNFERSKLL